MIFKYHDIHVFLSRYFKIVVYLIKATLFLYRNHDIIIVLLVLYYGIIMVLLQNIMTKHDMVLKYGILP